MIALTVAFKATEKDYDFLCYSIVAYYRFYNIKSSRNKMGIKSNKKCKDEMLNFLAVINRILRYNDRMREEIKRNERKKKCEIEKNKLHDESVLFSLPL